MNAHKIATSAAAALLLVAAAACDKPAEGPSRAHSEPPAASTTATSTAQTESERASADASELVREYFRAVDRVRQRPQVPSRSLRTVATGAELAAQQRLIDGERGDRLTQIGDTKVARLIVQSVSLDNSDPQAGKVPTVQVDVCWDVRDVDIVDAAGQSVVSPSRPDTGWVRLSVANYRWSDAPADGWRVASSEDIEKAPCSPT